ncbi:hypothetical protein [Mycoplasma bradburyae]|uniref:Lipoprotein n=1 Tax=Mycoplasma bradburyae TaxID=2963128 RepID=A0AAW6HRA0_9MOLU|nr:hypothetical protein [Mycoplasma bradburyae]MDC4182222.1 hypothetical protein [Mycoplasma bradburyae]MDC4183728.1 hypothetical protein [Mycoplasma bradburyae]UTS70047.1 hypothetical protein NMG68_03420 [Mycoplasma bradburyae]UTS70779.1 hypothetical protein NMG77_03445 [Mycoplasma bradburyae]
MKRHNKKRLFTTLFACTLLTGTILSSCKDEDIKAHKNSKETTVKTGNGSTIESNGSDNSSNNQTSNSQDSNSNSNTNASNNTTTSTDISVNNNASSNAGSVTEYKEPEVDIPETAIPEPVIPVPVVTPTENKPLTEKEMYINKYNALIKKVELFISRIPGGQGIRDSYKMALEPSVLKPLRDQVESMNNNFDSVKKSGKLDSTYQQKLSYVKVFANAMRINFDELEEGKLTDYEIEEARSEEYIKLLNNQKSQIQNAKFIRLIDDNVKSIRDTVSATPSAPTLKSYNDKDGAIYNTFADTYKAVQKHIEERKIIKQRIAEKTAEFDRATTPSTFSWVNYSDNNKIFDLSPLMYENIDVGDYYEPSENNLSYDMVFKNANLKSVINKYINLFREEIKQGRGEYDANLNARIELQAGDINTLKPLIAFNDKYVETQIKKWNKLRKKLHLPELINASTIFDEEDKAKLILQGILGYTRGNFIRNKEVRNDGKMLSTGHSYNVATRETVQKHKLTYGENYYGSYNSPLLSRPDYGLTSEFVSTVLFKNVLGERHAYAKYGLDDASKIREWGHLLGALDNKFKYFYAVIIAEDEGADPSFKEYNRYRVNINDMLFSVARNH